MPTTTKSHLMQNIELRRGDTIENIIRSQMEQGRTQEEIARDLGVSYWTFRSWLYRLGAQIEHRVRFASEETTATVGR